MIFQGFGDSGQNVQFSVWATRENWLTLRNTLPADALRALVEAGIEIGLPQRRLSGEHPTAKAAEAITEPS